MVGQEISLVNEVSRETGVNQYQRQFPLGYSSWDIYLPVNGAKVMNYWSYNSTPHSLTCLHSTHRDKFTFTITFS
jgi:hypothetical protein